MNIPPAEIDAKMGQVQALVRAFAILDLLARAERPLSLRDIAVGIRLPRSTCHRLLTTMQSLNYVRFEAETREWHVGRQAMTVGASFVRTRDLGAISRPIMRFLASEIGETVNLSRLDAGALTYVEQAAAKHAMPTFARPGVRLAAQNTAAGKVMLAHMSGVERRAGMQALDFAASTGRSIKDAAGLLAELDQAARLGYAIDDQENCPGIRCIAVPVFDECGAPCAALSVSGGAMRVTPERYGQLAQQLQVKAAAITREFGGLAA